VENNENNTPASGKPHLSLDDERRVKTLSPGAMTAKRFFRNRLAVAGLLILAVMFAFAFLGGALSPYGQDQVFYREDQQLKEFAAVSQNDTFRFSVAPGQEFGSVLQAQFTLAQGKQDTFAYRGVTYRIDPAGTDFYRLLADNTLVAIAYKDIVNPAENGVVLDFDFIYGALTAYTAGADSFTADDISYSLSPEGSITANGTELAFISRLIVQSRVSGTQIPRQFRAQTEQAIAQGLDSFVYEDASGQRQFSLVYDAANRLWSVREATATRVWDSYSAPSRAHPLGTDKNGMDMLTRLMYGGRISLVIGFIVVFISALLGVVLGGAAGYFGKWVDNLVMRIVDIFYCVPSTPLLIILGAAMDGMRVDPQLRMLYLMLILGFLGWPSIARLVRGQILSLREQEFMTAAEAAGLRVSRRIFRHLIPNVIPQLIVTCTMSLGSTILTEATLSFLGLGVKFPFASWGNIMNDVSNAHVLTSYWFVWIPAGVCLVLSVLGFNFVGDGLRDAFDPKMKR
jgi:peptide/nickel transport system permease protein